MVLPKSFHCTTLQSCLESRGHRCLINDTSAALTSSHLLGNAADNLGLAHQLILNADQGDHDVGVHLHALLGHVDSSVNDGASLQDTTKKHKKA